MNPQFAYIDPTAISYGAVAISGAAIAIGTVITMAVRKAKNKVKSALKLDENAGKETESAVEIVDDDDDE